MATYLVDTDMILEATRPTPDPRMLAFRHKTDEERLFLSVVRSRPSRWPSFAAASR